MIPLSTALWDPKWYHQFQGHQHIYRDKNGVYNGYRLEALAPGDGCDGLCRGADQCNSHDPNSCEFLKKYREQLDQIDFNSFMKSLINFGDEMKKYDGFSGDPVIVLIVHEAPSNPCSERGVLQAWFRDHGYLLNEWSKDTYMPQ